MELSPTQIPKSQLNWNILFFLFWSWKLSFKNENLSSAAPLSGSSNSKSALGERELLGLTVVTLIRRKWRKQKNAWMNGWGISRSERGITPCWLGLRKKSPLCNVGNFLVERLQDNCQYHRPNRSWASVDGVEKRTEAWMPSWKTRAWF